MADLYEMMKLLDTDWDFSPSKQTMKHAKHKRRKFKNPKHYLKLRTSGVFGGNHVLIKGK